MIRRTLAATVLGLAAMACPALVAAQQSAAVDVRIVVAPVDRIGFEEADAGEVPAVAEVVEQRGTRPGGPSTEEPPALRASAAAAADQLRITAAGSMLPATSSDAGVALCPRPAARRGFPSPVVMLSRSERPSSEADGRSVQVVTCTLIAP